MIHVSVRRTFLEFEEREGGGASAPQPLRARSLDSRARGSATELEAVFSIEQYELVPRGARRPLGPSRTEDAPSRPPGKFPHVVSSCSVSTMASLTDEVRDSKPPTPYMASCSPVLGPVAPPKSAVKRRRAAQGQEALSPATPQPKVIQNYCHLSIPKTVDLAEEFRRTLDDPQSAGQMTTLMLRHIPNRYTQRELILELEELGFEGTFDFLYLPLDKGTMSNVGYAFVNFVETALAEKCLQAFQSHGFRRHYKKATGKTAAVSYAHIQGLEANLRHYEKAAISTVKQKQRRPWVMALNLSDGCGVPGVPGAPLAGAGSLA